MTTLFDDLITLTEGKPTYADEFYVSMSRAERVAMSHFIVGLSEPPQCAYKLLKKSFGDKFASKDWTQYDIMKCIEVERARKYEMPPVPVTGLLEKADAAKAQIKVDVSTATATVTSLDKEYLFKAERQVVMREPYVKKPSFDEVYHFYSTVFCLKDSTNIVDKVDLVKLFGANNQFIGISNLIIVRTTWQKLFFAYNKDVPEKNFKGVYERLTLSVLSNCQAAEYLIVADNIFKVLRLTVEQGSNISGVRKSKDFQVFAATTGSWAGPRQLLEQRLGHGPRLLRSGLQLPSPKRTIEKSEDTGELSVYDLYRKTSHMVAAMGGNDSVLLRKILNYNFPFRPSPSLREQLIVWYVVKSVFAKLEPDRKVGVFCPASMVAGLTINLEKFSSRVVFLTDPGAVYKRSSDLFSVFFNFSSPGTLPSNKSEKVVLQKVEDDYSTYDVYYGPIMGSQFVKNRKLYKFVLNSQCSLIMSKIELDLEMDIGAKEKAITWEEAMKYFESLLNYLPGRALSFLGWKKYHWALAYVMRVDVSDSPFAQEALEEFKSSNNEIVDNDAYDNPTVAHTSKVAEPDEIPLSKSDKKVSYRVKPLVVAPPEKKESGILQDDDDEGSEDEFDGKLEIADNALEDF